MACVFFVTALFLQRNSAAQSHDTPVVAFPGAEGYGKYTRGGRGGLTYIVSNLNDNGPGSLRAGIAMKGPRTIVFAVSGTIVLQAPLTIENGDITIAGQTAPGDGICIRDYPVAIEADNVIIRYMRFRLGDARAVQGDALSAIRHKDIIIDHCSISWATDECASFYDNENFTLQWSIIAESLNASVHEKGEHGYGGIWGGKGASFHHNLLAHHNSRNPRFCGSRYHKEPAREIVDFCNNVIYNWKGNCAYGGERGNHHMVNNYYKPGPATTSDKRTVMINPFRPYGKFYLSGNVMESDGILTADNRKGVKCEHPDSAYMDKPVAPLSLPAQPAEEAYSDVLAFAGASQHRDAVDTRLVDEVKHAHAKYGQHRTGIIDSQKDVGGWPTLRSQTPPQDKDADGLPDAWEVSHTLNPNNAADAITHLPNNPYTALEVYINQLAR